jgi:protein SCO1
MSLKVRSPLLRPPASGINAPETEQPESAMTRLYAALAAAVALIFLGGLFAYVQMLRGDDAFAQCRQGNVAGGDIGGPFTLVNTEGTTVTDSEVLADPALVYFGYTFCPDICPFDMARNVEAVDLLAARGHPVTPVFISVDPERDTPEALADYAANMHPELVALTGTLEQVKAVANAYRTSFQKQPAEDEFYLVSHMTHTYLMLPGTGFVDFFRRDLTSEQLAESVACFLDASDTSP